MHYVKYTQWGRKHTVSLNKKKSELTKFDCDILLKLDLLDVL